MRLRDEVGEFIERWMRLTQMRDADRAADLFQRDPSPLVTFSDGERVKDWLDVRVRLGRDIERAFFERFELHHLELRELSGDTVAVSFAYDLHLRDMWATHTIVTRLATMTLVRTKDGFRIAAAHFSAPPA